MKYSADLLRAIMDWSLEQSRRYSDAISTLKGLASDGAISWDEVERIEGATKPYMDKENAAHDSARHALAFALGLPRLPFMPEPAPLTAEEEAILDKAVHDYYGA
jgi:hypothetical protein